MFGHTYFPAGYFGPGYWGPPELSYQSISPDADSVDGSWTDQSGGTSLFAAIDEASPSDADYIQSPAVELAPNNICKISLANPSSGPEHPLQVSYRIERQGSNEGCGLKVRLLQGSTTKKEWTHVWLPTDPVTITQTLTTGELATISDFNDLFVEFENIEGFSPQDLGSDLVAWYDANSGVYSDAGSTLATDGQSVQQWNDRSGNGYHASQATAAYRPVFRSSLPSGVRRAVEFVGGTENKILLTGTSAVSLGGTLLSIFGVAIGAAAIPSVTDNRLALFLATGQTFAYNNVGSCVLMRRPGEILSGYRNSSGTLSGQVIETEKPYRLGGIWDGTNFTSYVNNSGGAAAASAGTFGTTGAIGLGSEDFFSAWQGWISEVLFVKRVLDSTERANLDAYFAAKWGF